MKTVYLNSTLALEQKQEAARFMQCCRRKICDKEAADLRKSAYQKIKVGIQ
ncbi:hypothetical protein J4410_03670 [Candidatus Woesearchaeota archaeon]|nr:hypothetical protein [Candidatus Woesearchaeota archaeon]